MAPTLQQCPVCFNHYRSTPDGKLCRHGGKVKGQECSGSRKKVDPSGARAASPLGAAPDPRPGLPTRSSAASVSGDPLGLDYSGVFDKLTAVLKCVPVYDHIPKPCREKFAHDLNALLTAVCNDPGDPAHWVRLHCFVPYVLQKTSRGGRRVNQGNLVNKRLSEYSTIGLETLVLCFDGFNNAKSQMHNPDRWINAVSSCIEQGNLSSAVRLVCSPEGLAESSPATFDKLCSIHPKFRLPKLMYFLRTSKHIDPSKLGEFDGALRTALSSICNVQEPSGISAHDGRRPDGCTLIPWRAGRCLAWDVTVPGTLAERYVNLTSKECGLAAARAADEKMKKYGNALPSMEFLPICIEVLGPMDPNTLKFLKEIGKRISVRSGAVAGLIKPITLLNGWPNSVRPRSSFNTDHNTKPRRHNPNSWISAVITRIEQGSLSAAVRLACSPAGLAESSPETLAKLKAIHPSAPLNRRAFPAQEPSNGRVSPAQVLTALKSFNNGSSGGLDGLRPQHIKDLLSGPTPTDELLNNLTRLVNLLLSGVCPPAEPSGIAAHDGKRPDGCTLIPWRAGRCLAWDVTVPGIFAERYVQLTSKKKRSGDSREYFFAMNNISCILQRFLRVCVLENVELNVDGVE
ncbi:hypothetical protein HELRODRAFT_184331 [Helobdella robusta]|uniref:Uncharacterized protein n=1 Tax=Helobdella robusta TaxID=6412 RepID=T1FL06_HELRO|nr:hypothetical protein HELRODRAFT_184331 [Helobdella robusta]ESO01196.1 hypothetical protein HELRODRAFT_184331 [Helobdella robusta]